MIGLGEKGSCKADDAYLDGIHFEVVGLIVWFVCGLCEEI